MFDARNDVPRGVRTKLVRLLNERLADAPGTQVKHAHWNAKGPNFIARDELFDKIAEEVAEHSDTLAKRATALGGSAHGTLGAAALDALAAQALDARTALADAGTADLFAGIARQLDQDRWFLEAHLHPKR